MGPTAPDELSAIFAEFGVQANICAPATEDLESYLQGSIDKKPDLLVVLAGDGTARLAAELCGPKGPVMAPLPGGTMNMLPHAVYGVRPWQEALRLALEHGEEQLLGGGEVEGHRFLCGAIVGSPALWAPAREAARKGRVRQAWIQGRRALRRAFTGRLRYTLDGGGRAKAEALVLMCPIASKVMDSSEEALEAAALNVHSAAEAFRLGINAVFRDWREDPAVDDACCKVARIWSAQGIPALLDGEPVRLKSLAEIKYAPSIVRVLALPRELL